MCEQKRWPPMAYFCGPKFWVIHRLSNANTMRILSGLMLTEFEEPPPGPGKVRPPEPDTTGRVEASPVIWV